MEIALTGPNSNFLEEFLKVLKAYKHILVKEALTEDLPQSIKETLKVDQIKEAAKGTYKIHQQDGFKGTAKYLGSGISSTFFNIMYSPIALSKATKTEIVDLIRKFKEIEDDQEKLTFILEHFSYLASTTAGAYIGYNIPDKDIKCLGIGGHRNFAFHSVAPAIALIFLSKFINRILDRVDIDNLNDKDKNLHRIIKNNVSLFTTGGILGIAGHLAEDAILEGSKAVTSPWGNTWIKGTLIDDKSYLFFNGFSCFPFCKKS